MKTFPLFLYIVAAFLLVACASGQNPKSPPQDQKSFENNEAETETTVINVEPKNHILPVPQNLEDIVIQDIDFNKIQTKFSEAKYTWVVMWASWCMLCQQNLGKYPWIADSLKNKDIQLIIVLQDDDTMKAKKILFLSGMGLQTYKISNETYSVEEKERTLAFRNQLCKPCKSYDIVTPHHFLYNKQGELIFQRVGVDIDKKMILDKINPPPKQKKANKK